MTTPNSILQLPTAAQPLVLNFSGHIPSLKNNKQLVPRSDNKVALISNVSIDQFYRSFYASGSQQFLRSKFDSIPYGVPVMVYVELWFFCANDTGIAPSDADNAYTTLQELLAPRSKKHPYYLGVVQDDKQIIDFRCRKYAVRERPQEGARMFIWSTKLDSDGFDEMAIFYEFYKTYRNRPRKQLDQDLNEILTWL